LSTLIPRMPETLHGRRLAQNSLLTLATHLLLLAAAIVLIPFMLDAFGRELFGILSLTWMLLAHLEWLDLGLSRAAAKYVARDLTLARTGEAARWAWTALLTQMLLGFLGAAGLWFAAPAVLRSVQVEPQTEDVALLAFHLFALAIPFELSSRSLTGVLQAGQRFQWINGYRLLTSSWMYIVYLLGVVEGSFVFVVYGLFAQRVIGFAALLWAANRVVPLRGSFPGSALLRPAYRGYVKELLRFGSWVTVATILGPLIVYFNQWTIGVLLGVATLPLYAIPHNVLTRLYIFPFSITQTLFPAFSALEATGEWDKIQSFFVRSHRYLIFTLIPLIFVIYTWAHELLRLWISTDFADQAATPLRVLAIGFGIGLLGPLSGALLEGIGRPDVLAKLYVVELPLYVALVVVLTREFGLVGAAATFAVRSAIEIGVLWVLIGRIVRFSREAMMLAATTGKQALLVLLPLGAAAYLLQGSELQDARALSVTLAVLVVYTGAVLAFVFDERDRTLLKSLVRRVAV
jgi:O-antigen/teichoic acid export membrane protein